MPRKALPRPGKTPLSVGGTIAMRQALGLGLEFDILRVQDLFLRDLVGDELQDIPKQA